MMNIHVFKIFSCTLFLNYCFSPGVLNAQTTINISPANATYSSGTIGPAIGSYAKSNGDINLLAGNNISNYGNGWIRFDLSGIPSGATITAASVFYNASNASGTTYIKGYSTTTGSTSDATIATGATFYNLCAANNTPWVNATGSSGNHTEPLGATGISYIQSNYSASPVLMITFATSGTSITQTTTIRGYNTANAAQQPYLIITYTSGTSVAAPTITANNSPVCAGSTITLTASSTATSPTFNWTGPGFSATGATINIPNATAANAGVYSVTVTSGSVTSAATTATVVVNPIVSPTIAITANPATTVCSGTSVTFTAVPVNGGVTPVYQWKKNNVNTGTNSSSYTDNALNNNDVITCQLTSNASCTNPTTSNSNTLTMTVSSSATASISIGANPGSAICSGKPVTFTATATNGGATPAYQWKKNGSNVGINAATYTDNTLSNNNTISCQLTSSLSCANPSITNSNTITMTVHALPVKPTITINGNVLSSSGPSGNQWIKNNADIAGANNQTYTAIASGWYQVSVTDGNGCSNKSDSIFYSSTSGIETNLSDENILVYPSPFVNKIIVQLNNNMRRNVYNFVLTNQLGETVYKQQFSNVVNEIHFGELAKGIYFLSITGNNVHHIYKMIKE